MSYNRTTWVNDETPLNQGNMNNIEEGILEALDAAASNSERITQTIQYIQDVEKAKVDGEQLKQKLDEHNLDEEAHPALMRAINDKVDALGVRELIKQELSEVIGNAPEDLDTLEELIAYIKDHEGEALKIFTALNASIESLNRHTEDENVHINPSERDAWNAHTKDEDIHVELADKMAWDAHKNDESIHITPAQKQTWDAKADAVHSHQANEIWVDGSLVSDEFEPGKASMMVGYAFKMLKDAIKDGSFKDADRQSILDEADQHISTEIAKLLDGSVESLDTLKELAEALGNDPNFATTVLQKIGEKADADHNHDDLYASWDHTHEDYINKKEIEFTGADLISQFYAYENGFMMCNPTWGQVSVLDKDNFDGYIAGMLRTKRFSDIIKENIDEVTLESIGAAAADHDHDDVYMKKDSLSDTFVYDSITRANATNLSDFFLGGGQIVMKDTYCGKVVGLDKDFTQSVFESLLKNSFAAIDHNHDNTYIKKEELEDNFVYNSIDHENFTTLHTSLFNSDAAGIVFKSWGSEELVAADHFMSSIVIGSLIDYITQCVTTRNIASYNSEDEEEANGFGFVMKTPGNVNGRYLSYLPKKEFNELLGETFLSGAKFDDAHKFNTITSSMLNWDYANGDGHSGLVVYDAQRNDFYTMDRDFIGFYIGDIIDDKYYLSDMVDWIDENYAAIEALQTADANNVKITGAQTIAGVKTFSGNCIFTGTPQIYNLRIKGSGNYSEYLYFGDGSYVYFREDVDDHLTLYAKNGFKYSSLNQSKPLESDSGFKHTSYDDTYVLTAGGSVKSLYDIVNENLIDVINNNKRVFDTSDMSDFNSGYKMSVLFFDGETIIPLNDGTENAFANDMFTSLIAGRVNMYRHLVSVTAKSSSGEAAFSLELYNSSYNEITTLAQLARQLYQHGYTSAQKPCKAIGIFTPSAMYGIEGIYATSTTGNVFLVYRYSTYNSNVNISSFTITITDEVYTDNMIS